MRNQVQSSLMMTRECSNVVRKLMFYSSAVTNLLELKKSITYRGDEYLQIQDTYKRTVFAFPNIEIPEELRNLEPVKKTRISERKDLDDFMDLSSTNKEEDDDDEDDDGYVVTNPKKWMKSLRNF